jgi:hypothetical protein
LYGLEPANYWKLIIDGLQDNASGEYALSVKEERFRIEKLGSSSNLKFVYGDLLLATVMQLIMTAQLFLLTKKSNLFRLLLH